MTKDSEFIFQRHGNTIYAFGLNGRGFKHMMYHGKRVYELIQGDRKESEKYEREVFYRTKP